MISSPVWSLGIICLLLVTVLCLVSVLSHYPAIHRLLFSYWFMRPIIYILVTLLCVFLLSVTLCKNQDSLIFFLNLTPAVFHAFFVSSLCISQELSLWRKLRCGRFCLISFRDHSSELPVVRCLKSFSYIFSSFLIAYSGSIILGSVSHSWSEAEDASQFWSYFS